MEKAFAERVEKYKDTVKDNSMLPAGSPILWWCTYCGDVSDRRPENYDPRDYGAPSRVCGNCLHMFNAGGKFDRSLDACKRWIWQ